MLLEGGSMRRRRFSVNWDDDFSEEKNWQLAFLVPYSLRPIIKFLGRKRAHYAIATAICQATKHDDD